ncbi:membrane protein [Couchioplanes caeruleus subsp. azureus]|nr:membrane protein [Couchioplanes caeruleus subsp. azureus]
MLVALWGVFALVDGIFAVVAAMLGRVVVAHRGWLVFSGMVGIAAGIVTFVWPSITALVLLYIIAFWAIVIGVLMIAAAVRLRTTMRHEWALGIAGGLSALLCVVLLVTPGAGALAVTWAIGWYALLFGVLVLTLAWQVRRQITSRDVASAGSRRGSARPAT